MRRGNVMARLMSAAILVSAAVFSATPAAATQIDEAVTLFVGDKKFTIDFCAQGGAFVDCGTLAIDVSAAAVGEGLVFAGLGGAPLATVGPGGSFGVDIVYSVAVTDPAFLISDIELTVGGAASGDATFSVTEFAFVPVTVDPLATLTADQTTVGAQVALLSTPRTRVGIRKSIIADGGETGFAAIFSVGQVLSQTPVTGVPEPATLLLLGTGLLGLIATGRRRH